MPMEQYVLNETKVMGNAPDSRRWSAVQEENISEGQKATRQQASRRKDRVPSAYPTLALISKREEAALSSDISRSAVH